MQFAQLQVLIVACLRCSRDSLVPRSPFEHQGTQMMSPYILWGGAAL